MRKRKSAVTGVTIDHLGANQVVIGLDGDKMFRSYESNIALIKADGSVIIGKDFEYSNTTMKYLKQFVGCGVAETRKNIKSKKWAFDEDL